MTGRRTPAATAAVSTALVAVAAACLYPLYYLVVNSLKTRAQYYADPFGLPLAGARVHHYVAMITQFQILTFLKNSLIVVTAGALLVTAFAVFAGYSFSKFRFRSKNALFIAILSTMLIPGQITIIPLYVLISKFGMINRLSSVVLVYLAGCLPASILLVSSYFKSIPNDLIGAARVDGCSYWQSVRHVIVPMGQPAIIINLILTGITLWNDLLIPLVLLQKRSSMTVMAALSQLMDVYSQEPTFQFTGLAISLVPIFAIFLLLQRFIIEGIAQGALK
jgi:multiple sugar transport system permease protein